METETSPPLPRISLIRLPTEVSPETLSVPFQDGVQPPESRMKASSKAFCPVASMTVPGSGVAVSLTKRYGAEAYQLLDSAVVAALLDVASAKVVPVAIPTAATAPSAANCFLFKDYSCSRSRPGCATWVRRRRAEGSGADRGAVRSEPHRGPRVERPGARGGGERYR